MIRAKEFPVLEIALLPEDAQLPVDVFRRTDDPKGRVYNVTMTS